MEDLWEVLQHYPADFSCKDIAQITSRFLSPNLCAAQDSPDENME